MPVVLTVLRTELLSSAQASLYSAGLELGDYNAVADAFNTSAASHLVSVGTVFALDMQQVVVASEYAVLSSGQRDLWGAIITVGVNGVAISNTVLRNQVAQVWSAGTTTRANLLGLDTRAGTRAEVLFGEHMRITPTDVQKALE